MSTRGNLSVRVVYEMFPHMAEIIKPEQISQVEIKEVNSDILGLFACSGFGPQYHQGVYFLDDEGKKIGECTYPYFSWFGHEETVKEALDRLSKTGLDKKITQVLCYADYQRDEIKLYRAPKTYTVSSWLEELRVRERAALEKRIEKINARGNNQKLLT